MQLRPRVCFTLIVAFGWLASTSAAAQAPQKPALVVPVKVSQLLTKQLQFSAADLTALAHGTIVVKSLPASEPREVAVAGAFWCNVPLDYFVNRARDIVSFKQVKEVQQIGVFGSPARVGDLAGMTIEPQDIEVLRRCAPGDCKFKLDRPGLERMRHEVTWSAPDPSAQVQRLARELIVAYVAAYQQSGKSALVEYADGETPVNVARGTEVLLNRMLWLHDAAPGLRQYADAYPRDPVAYADNLIYWSKEAFGMKPMVSATHTIIWRGPGGSGDATILARQVYASHYLDASISLTVLMKDERPAPGGVFVIYQNRSLVDLLQGGFLAPLKRSIARSRTKDGLTGQLEGLKKRLEGDYGSTSGKEPGSTGGREPRSTGGRIPRSTGGREH